jgi:hypothetical protein
MSIINLVVLLIFITLLSAQAQIAGFSQSLETMSRDFPLVQEASETENYVRFENVFAFLSFCIVVDFLVW